MKWFWHLFFCDWSSWKDTEIKQFYSGSPTTAPWVVSGQVKYCKICNKQKLREA